MLRFSGSGGGGGASNVGLLNNSLVRYFSRERAVNVKKINPKVPFPEAATISQSIYQVIKTNGPLTVSNTWTHLKEANVSGINSKTHMKIMLKWMRGRKLLKLFCNQVGSNKKFMHCTLPEEPRTGEPEAPEMNLQKKKPAMRRRKQQRK